MKTPAGITHILFAVSTEGAFNEGPQYALAPVEGLADFVAGYHKHMQAMKAEGLDVYCLEVFDYRARYCMQLPTFSPEFAQKTMYVGPEYAQPAIDQTVWTAHTAAEFEEHCAAEDVRTECDCMEIQERSIRFTAFLKNCDIRIATEPLYGDAAYKTVQQIYQEEL